MTSNRRTFLGASLGVATAVASHSTGLTATACNSAEGADLSCHQATRNEAAHDFGRLIHKTPRAVARPASSADVASMVRWATSRGLKIAARGQGHSIYGRALSEDGVVIDMSRISTIRHVQPNHIVVDAGATWQSVLDATLKQG